MGVLKKGAFAVSASAKSIGTAVSEVFVQYERLQTAFYGRTPFNVFAGGSKLWYHSLKTQLGKKEFKESNNIEDLQEDIYAGLFWNKSATCFSPLLAAQIYKSFDATSIF